MNSPAPKTRPNQAQNIEDLAIVGGGLSGSLLLRNVLSQLGGKPARQRRPPLKISVFDQEGDFGGGLAYGSKIGFGALLATSLIDFISDEAERKLFCAFLVRRKNDWIGRLRDDSYGKVWLERNQEQIGKDEFDSLYMPRFLVGIFFHESLTQAIKAAEISGIANVEFRRNPVVSINKSDDLFGIRYRDGGEILELGARHIALASGFPEQKKSSGPSADFCIDDIYSPSLLATLDLIKGCARRGSPASNQMLISGSSATCLELLYHIALSPEISSAISRITVISPSGAFPDAIRQDGAAFSSFPDLERIHGSGDPYTARDVITAAKADVRRARQQGFVASEFCEALVNKQILPLLDRLPLPEQRQFVEQHGSALVAMFRRAGQEYLSAVDSLTQAGKLQIIPGRLSRIHLMENKLEATVDYDAPPGDRLDPETKFQVIANCAGNPAIRESSSALLHQLCDASNLGIEINGSGRGLKVDDQFRAAENFYIIGELLTGLTNSTTRLWHVESADRIYGLASRIGAIIAEKLA